jgi:hypothetical protein
MHMSHKKRASFALKSMGAAGLAAATIVSGLSFGAPAASASDASSGAKTFTTAAESTLRGKFVAYGPTKKHWGYFGTPGASGGIPIGWATSLADGASKAGEWILPGSGVTGTVRPADQPNRCVTVPQTQWEVSLAPCTNAANQKFKWANGGKSLTSETSGGYLGMAGTSASLTTDSEIQRSLLSAPTALSATVASVNNVAKSAVVSGRATPGAKVAIGTQEAEANSSGAWSMTVTGLEIGKNDLVVIQKLSGTEYDRTTVSTTIIEGGGLFGVDQGPVELERGETTKVPFVVENRVSRTDTKGTVVLTAPDGAAFSEQDTVQGSWRRVGNTAWNASTSIPLSNGRLSNDNTTLTFDVDWASERPTDQQYRFLIDVTAAADAPEAPSAMEFDFSGTSSTNDFRAQGSTSTTIGTSVVDLTAEVASVDNEARSAVVTGTATPGADISIGDETAKADATTGAWSITVDDLEVGDNTLVVVQKINDREIDRKTVTATVEGRTELAPITLSGPASVTPGRSNTFTGTAEPGATFRVLNVSGTQIVPGTFEVGADGRWSFDRVVSNGASNFRFVIEQTKNGQVAKSELFTVNASALAPVTVTTPERVTPGRSNTFTGTGEPGATFRVLNISGTQIVPGTHEVDAQGNWTFNRVVSNGASNFRFVIEQTKNGQVEKSELFTINAADFAPVTVANRSVTPGVVNTFTGTGEPGASYRVLNITGTQIVPGTFEVDAEGNWTFDRAVSRGATEFRFALEQTKNGKTELSELFTLPADTK